MAGEQRGLEIKAEPGVIVPYRTGVALSLIASELVTNAFKYAYAPGDEGGVEVAIRRDEIGIRLTVCDQGKGLPEDWAERPSQGLGMKLIRAMLDQIGARLEVENTRGACFSIRI
jgi:two-component sensor histidine kinase